MWTLPRSASPSEFVGHDPASPEEIRGPEGFKQNVAAVRSAFPDFHMQIVDQVAEEDRVVTRYVSTGTQKGELTGIPPTSKRVEVDGMGIDYFFRRQDCGVVGVLRRYGNNAATGSHPLSGVEQPLPSVIR